MSGDAISRYTAAVERALRTGHGCGHCTHTECACDCHVCDAAREIDRKPCQCESCTIMRNRTIQ